MAERDAYAAQALNGLIEITLDSANGYAKAAELARNPSFQPLFQKRAASRRALTGTLQKKVRDLGGEAVDHGSLLGPAHRALLTLLDKMAGATDRAVIDEVARGEAFIHGRFEHVADDPGLSADLSAFLVATAGDIGAEREEIETFQDQFHGTAPAEPAPRIEDERTHDGQLQAQ